MSIVPVAVRRPVRARDPHEERRAATPLELLFDLVFVVAVASNATELHHGLTEGHWSTVTGYALTWFAIWWAWVNYTWYASAYDNDDVVFRLLTFGIMTGALFLAAGVPALFESGSSGMAVLGYAVMRFAMVGLWLRAAAGHPERRTTALSYAAGIALVQVLWIARLWAPEGWYLWTFLALVVAELAVPYVAERRGGRTPYHPHHIAERYGLMTIIVLGEVILASVVAIQSVIAAGGATEGGGGHTAPVESPGTAGLTWSMAPLVLGAIAIVFSLWWSYFAREHADLVEKPGIVWLFGYGHYFVFAGIAAVGAAVAASVDVVTGVSDHGRGALVALAVAISTATLALAAMHAAGEHGWSALLPGALVAAACLLVALTVPSVPWGVLLMGVVLVGLVVHKVRLAGPGAA